MIDRTVQEAEPKDNGLERLMFARISVWKVLLGLVFGMIVTVILLAAVRSTAFGGKRFGLVGEAAMTVASIPATMHEALAAPDDFDLLRVNLPYEALPDGFSARARPASRIRVSCWSHDPIPSGSARSCRSSACATERC